MPYQPAERPTLYFIGVTTAKSSIMRVFPEWARHLGLGDAAIRGIDFPLHADAASYREAVAFIREDPLSRGALVTTHKIDLFQACRDMFDRIDPHAAAMGEVSCISKRGSALVCHAKDPISSGLAMREFLPDGYFCRSRAEVFLMGAGGSTIAISWHLTQESKGRDVPSRIVVSNRSPGRLDHIRQFHREIGMRVPVEYGLARSPEDNDAILARLAPGSLVVNATGLGKDAPGSPLTAASEFPLDGITWDLNYRGDLVFLEQARVQAERRRLRVADGWTYFLHGWTQVISEVFEVAIPTGGSGFEVLSRIAATARV
jgi:shikimate 5-dehydrogenase